MRAVIRGLAATREVIDTQQPGAWHSNIYMSWLAALRALSAPTTDAQYPEAMRTRAWAMKNLNTQLASWTQLRHDTILYAKQSYSGMILCSYPYGFVEPRPEFWQAVTNMAYSMAEMISKAPYQGYVEVDDRSGTRPPWQPLIVSLADLRSAQVAFLRAFGSTAATLDQIAQKELAQQPLSTNETKFLNDWIENGNQYVGIRAFTGQYPKLFYRNLFAENGYKAGEGSDQWDPLVTDVHTDSVDIIHGDPGCVLHEGVGNVNLLMIAIDNGPDRMVYAGPVMSHYEFETPLGQRKTDSEWQSDINSGKLPPPPEWTKSYLVPVRK